MCSPMSDVARFMDAVGHVEVTDEQQNLYWNLIGEEHGELVHARLTANRKEELDAILDTIWVLIGYGLSRGYDLECGWREVARSNLDKIGPDGHVHRRPDGKILKPAGWTPPNIEVCL